MELKIRKKILIALIILLLLLLIGGGIYLLTQGNGAAQRAGSTALSIDPNAGEYAAPDPEETDSDGGITIPGWGSISLPAGQTQVTVDFPNPAANADKYYLSFELRLKDTDETLCTTGLVPLGQTIQTITLSRALEAGEYAAVIRVQPYRMDEAQTPTNNADMETTLVVYEK